MDCLDKDLDSKIYLSPIEAASTVCSQMEIMLCLFFFVQCCSDCVSNTVYLGDGGWWCVRSWFSGDH